MRFGADQSLGKRKIMDVVEFRGEKAHLEKL
jgi:hypothetical protein